MIAIVADAQAVAHAVEASEVGGAFAGQDEVVGTEGVVEVRARNLDHFSPEVLEDPHRLAEALLHAGLVALPRQFLHQADAHAAYVGSFGRCHDVGHRRRDRGRVTRVVTADDRLQERSIHDGARAGPGLVEARRQGDEAEARNPAVGGLNANSAGDGCGLADRSAGVGADGQGRLE